MFHANSIIGKLNVTRHHRCNMNEKPEQEMTGVVRSWNLQKGIGRITPDEGDYDIFVHHSNVLMGGFVKLYPGEQVTFYKKQNEKGEFADNVRLIDEAETGKVIHYDGDEGMIQAGGGSDQIPFQAYDIQSKGFPEFEEGEPVTFKRHSDRLGLKAIRVQKMDRRRPLEKFAFLQQLDHSLDKLAAMTGENWNYRQNPMNDPKHPILENYIYNTYTKLKKEGKVKEATDRKGKKWASFNTGLATQQQDEIFACFSEAQKKDNLEPRPLERPKWYFEGFFTKTEGPMACFSPLPELANYFKNGADLIYDTSRELRTREHIFGDRKSRFLEIPGLPEDLQKEDALRRAFEEAIRLAERRVRRNYKTAIPMYSPARDRIQLLLPLCIISKQRADLALLVDPYEQVNMGWTVLTLDMAYNNARLLARPDSEWLVP